MIQLDDTKEIYEPQYSYDDGVDVLYISFGEPRAGVATEVANGVFIRTSLSDGGEIVGITIMNFNEIGGIVP